MALKLFLALIGILSLTTTVLCSGLCGHTEDNAPLAKVGNMTEGVGAFIWIPPSFNLMFAMSRTVEDWVGGRLYKADDGSTWNDITYRLEGAITDDSTADGVYLRGILWMEYHEKETQKLLVGGPSQSFYTTDDAGVTWTAKSYPNEGYGLLVHDVQWHPKEVNWILMKQARPECISVSPMSPACAYDAMLSKDFGTTWTNLTQASNGAVTSFQDIGWAAAINPSDHDSIFATVYESVEDHKGLFPDWDYSLHFVVIEDFFEKKSHNKLVPCGNQFEAIGSSLYLAVPSGCPWSMKEGDDGAEESVDGDIVPSADSGSSSTPVPGSGVELFISDSEGKKFNMACIPAMDLDLYYSIMKSTDGEETYLSIDHDEQDGDIAKAAAVTTLYSAGAVDSMFTFVAASVWMQDVMIIEGLKGSILLNQVDPNAFNDYAVEEMVKEHGIESVNAILSTRLQTRVSWDAGKSWSGLAVGSNFAYEACHRCPQGSYAWSIR